MIHVRWWASNFGWRCVGQSNTRKSTFLVGYFVTRMTYLVTQSCYLSSRRSPGKLLRWKIGLLLSTFQSCEILPRNIIKMDVQCSGFWIIPHPHILLIVFNAGFSVWRSTKRLRERVKRPFWHLGGLCLTTVWHAVIGQVCRGGRVFWIWNSLSTSPSLFFFAVFTQPLLSLLVFTT